MQIAILMRRLIRKNPALRWFAGSYQAKLILVILLVLVTFAYLFARAEGESFFEALFISIIMLLGEPTDPATNIGKISVLVMMVSGIVLFAFIIGEFSSYLLERIINRGKVKVVKRYGGTGHIVICGFSDKVEGIMRELRSEALERLHPVVILSPKAGDISFSDDSLKKNTVAIEGEPLDTETLDKANLEGARSILILSAEETIRGKKMYRDAYVALVYNTVYNYLSGKDKAPKVKGDVNVVMEFLDEGNNLLPCARGLENQPEVYTTLIPGTKWHLTVEPIYLENMPRYLFIQSILNRNTNTIVQELINSQMDTCEFYYREVLGGGALAGKSFYEIERALLGTGVTPIGVLRRSSVMAEMAVSGYEDAGRVELLLNPETGITLEKGDKVVLISYDEGEVRKVFDGMVPGKAGAAPSKPGLSGIRAKLALPFDRVFVINWNPYMLRDMLTEMTTICDNVARARGSSPRMEIAIVSGQPQKELDEGLERVMGSVRARGMPVDEFIEVRIVSVKEPVGLKEMKGMGITKESAGNSRVLILSGQDDDEGADLRTLHLLQIIENRISDRMFTAVELIDSRNYHYFKNSRADVIVSIDAFAEQLMAQALLKPYVSLIFRNMLTFTEDTNEFYFREVPGPFIGKTYRDLQGALVGYPIILVGHVRAVTGKSSITLNPKATGEYDDAGRPRRIMKSEKLEKGDSIILIAREPEMVDAVLDGMSAPRR